MNPIVKIPNVIGRIDVEPSGRRQGVARAPWFRRRILGTPRMPIESATSGSDTQHSRCACIGFENRFESVTERGRPTRTPDTFGGRFPSTYRKLPVSKPSASFHREFFRNPFLLFDSIASIMGRKTNFRDCMGSGAIIGGDIVIYRSIMRRSTRFSGEASPWPCHCQSVAVATTRFFRNRANAIPFNNFRYHVKTDPSCMTTP